MSAYQKPPAISKLPCDVLWRIFCINTGRDETLYYSPGGNLIAKEVNPLKNTRQASQVCQTWRNFLLQSPSLWARCIHLDELAQKQGDWRDLVIGRTGQSLLYVSHSTGLGREMLAPGYVLWNFFVNLLDEHWARIRELDVKVASRNLDKARIWEVFSRPSENLRMFAVKPVFDLALTNHRRPEYLPLNFQLFSNRAPSLVYLYVSPIFWPTVNIKRGLMFSNNLRHLDLNLQFTPVIEAIDLLSVFLHMSSLETLALQIAYLTTNSSPALDSLLPSVPRLKLIDVTCGTLDIFPIFLDRITPAAGCALRSTLCLRPLVVTDDTLSSMQRVIERYAHSFFAHHDFEGQTGEADVRLYTDTDSFSFKCFQKLFQICVSHISDSRVVARLLDAVSTFKFPCIITHLTLSLHSGVDRTPLVPALLQAMATMSSVTELRTCPLDFSSLQDDISGCEIVFPLLRTLSIYVTERADIQRNVVPFILKRQHTTASIQVLVLDCSHTHCILRTDLCFLDKITGLTILWTEGGKENQYVCGSGDESKLLIG